MASDEGPSSPKLISDFAPFYAEAREALFGSLASTNNLGDSNTFLPGVEEARSCHDVLHNLSYPDIQCRLDGLTLLELANFHDGADLRLRDEVVVLKKQQFESARVVSKLVVDLEKAKDGQGFRESMFGCDLKDEDSRLLKDRFEEKEVVYLSTEASLRSKIDVLNDKLKLANQEQSLLVREKAMLVVGVKPCGGGYRNTNISKTYIIDLEFRDGGEKAFRARTLWTCESDNFSVSLIEVASSGVDLELEDMKDFDPNVEETYDRAIDAFYQVKLPCVDLLVYYAGQSIGKLMTLNPPIIPFGNAFAVGPSASPFL
ncbi:hypothetical protein Tco_0684573 [Tanacetum coccineum]